MESRLRSDGRENIMPGSGKRKAPREGEGAPGGEESGGALGGMGRTSRGTKSLRPDLRTDNSDEGRTSYWQSPGQTRQNTARTVSRALRGSPSICVTRSKVRPQAIWSHEMCGPSPQGTAAFHSSLHYCGPGWFAACFEIHCWVFMGFSGEGFGYNLRGICQGVLLCVQISFSGHLI